MSRPIQASINLPALTHNLSIVRKHAPNSRIMAVIKADAYGHGLLPATQALRAADGFALLELDAAITLREAGFKQPILLLEGFFSMQELRLFQQFQLNAVIHHSEQISMLLASKERNLGLFIKINTGMNRLGLRPEQYLMGIKKLQENSYANNVTLMTHFACADDSRQKESVLAQINCFKTITQQHNYPISLANSAAIIRYPETHGDWVRPGILLYGASPFTDQTAEDLKLQSVMTLSSKVIAIHDLRAGDRVGYGGFFHASRPMRIGIVACGYADGYPRHAPTGTPVLVNNQPSRLLGRVSMDMLTVDLTHIPNAGINSSVILWGSGVSVDEIANRSNTISYELLSALAPRVERTVAA